MIVAIIGIPVLCVLYATLLVYQIKTGRPRRIPADDPSINPVMRPRKQKNPTPADLEALAWRITNLEAQMPQMRAQSDAFRAAHMNSNSAA